MIENFANQPDEITWKNNKYLYLWTEGSDISRFQPYTIVHAVCFNDKGEVLIQHENGEWRFPGGGNEDGEPLVETVSRETIEETGVVPKDIQLMGAFRIDELSTPEGKRYYQLCVFCKVDTIQTREPNPENIGIDEVKFVKPEEVLGYINWGNHGIQMFENALKHFKFKN